ncbi:hypothetical protein PS9374_02899 [Planomonospora sphaerica]|uniref:Uncharacterized protein n=1 Tax=Planomonospora sphaerica TaxID=161355 RepID=A0A171CUM3_9ACTN|nr:hypothetical protein [Planomonospora sphaerica]GAT67246.1 hypothetical protein PS9374_02899 [Planomonospora sphaerica]
MSPLPNLGDLVRVDPEWRYPINKRAMPSNAVHLAVWETIDDEPAGPVRSLLRRDRPR